MEETHEGHTHGTGHGEHAAHPTGEHTHPGHEPAAHHPEGHHAGGREAREREEEYLKYAVAVAFILIIASAFFAMNTISKAVGDLADAMGWKGGGTSPTPTPLQTRTPAPTPTPIPLANVVITELVDTNCTECFNVSLVMAYFAQVGPQMGMNVSEKRSIAANSSEGLALIGRYNITKIPTILLSKEARNTQIIRVWNQSGTVEPDGTLVLREVYPPYIDLRTGKLTGKVKIIHLTPANCTECFSGDYYEYILTQFFSIAIGETQNLTYSSSEGQALVSRYNISAVPALLVSPELNLYPGMEERWLNGMGSKEGDGWYVFRNMSALGNVTYFDIIANRTATAERAPAP